MQYDGNYIAWSHLEDLFKQCQADSGLNVLYKLKYEHIHLTSYSKMRVDLAAQVCYIF